MSRQEAAPSLSLVQRKDRSYACPRFDPPRSFRCGRCNDRGAHASVRSTEPAPVGIWTEGGRGRGCRLPIPPVSLRLPSVLPALRLRLRLPALLRLQLLPALLRLRVWLSVLPASRLRHLV